MRTDVDIKLKNITKFFGNFAAVSNFSLEINKGEFIALIGPSGCGKTTLLKVISGIEQSESGEVHILGENVTRYPPQKRSAIMVWQSLALFPHMNVEANVGFGLYSNGMRKKDRNKRINEVLDMVNLTGYNKRSIKHLSGGEKQRVAFARALAPNPPILLLDEPFGSIDYNLSLKLQSEISKLHKKLGVTFVLVTHNRSEAISLADRIAVMNAGCLEQIGTPKEVLYQPINKFVAEFLGNNNILSGEISDVNGKEIKIKNSMGVFYGYLSKSVCKNPKKGEMVAYVIPRHSLVFSSSYNNFTNKIIGRCIGRQLVGSIVSYLIELEDNNVFNVERHLSEVEQFLDLKYEDTVELGWDSKNAIVVYD